MTPRRCRLQAFTLVEIMVSMVILALVISAIYASWFTIIKGSSAAQKAAAEVQRLRVAMQTLEQAFVGARLFAGNVDLYSFEAQNDGNFADIVFTSKLPKSFPRSGRFGDFDVRRVAFSVEAVNGRENQLVLRQSPLLMELDEDEDQFPLVLARNVTAFNVEFWDTTRFQWKDQWTQTNQLPKMVRISLGVGRKNTYQSTPNEQIVRVVALAATAVPLGIQRPRLGGPPGPGRGPLGGATNQPGMQPILPGGGPAGGNPPRPPRAGGGFGF